MVQSHNPNGTPGAWEVIGSKIVDEDAPTVLLYAHHDVQPVPDASAWNTDPFVGTVIDTRLYGRGAADDGGGIAIHSGALQALGDDLKVNIKVFIEGEEEMGSPSFIPFIEEHKDEFDSDVIIVATRATGPRKSPPSPHHFAATPTSTCMSRHCITQCTLASTADRSSMRTRLQPC